MGRRKAAEKKRLNYMCFLYELLLGHSFGWRTGKEEKDVRCVELGAKGDDQDGGAESRGRRETRYRRDTTQSPSIQLPHRKPAEPTLTPSAAMPLPMIVRASSSRALPRSTMRVQLARGRLLTSGIT
ncbi:uncharacterized protein [Aegilops tauschii subsp. strangulata]|uniref:uncharacterized protein isoform X3 n=1 Tax=Aegilops tauschii subsp. strangulata TaxID=200361 RepID=UPI003CC8DE74